MSRSLCTLSKGMMIALCNASKLSVTSHDVKVKKQLSQFNKTPLKFIKSKDGDVIDCVDISQQPAFDDPLLKNHNIKMRPNNYPESAFVEANNKPITQLWQLNGRCPTGTIPIRRTKKEDVLRAISIKSNIGKKQNYNFHKTSQDNVEYVIAAVEGESYHGAKASINVWEPQVENHNAVSSSQLWIYGGPYKSSNLNIIEAGWHDPSHDVWWLGFGSRTNGYWTTIGYWPSSLFTTLANNASAIEWGGLVVSSESDGQQTTTQMGSGHFPEEGFSRASYMRNLQVMDESFNSRPLSNPSTNANQPNCYNITLGKTNGWGDFIFYGGPGRNPNCP
ncbi:hypothetical protein ACH5RR_032789 [Cinchona calisaya]|uniref:Neprosin PEP catalytic domain-containing protein n=1 Tax=Cinchona calisaya TaxID=153742 RepID=A0ABD2YNH5_9GENT